VKIVVAARCRNGIKHIPSFLKGYDFADEILVSDGGSTDGSVEFLRLSGVRLIHFDQEETINGETWNPDAPHINYVLDYAKSLNPDWIVFDDLDCHPNQGLREDARWILETTPMNQINVFRLYLWGENKFFPAMNGNFNLDYTSLWAWRPKELDIRADPNIKHGTIVGMSKEFDIIAPPYCLLHKSWSPETIDAKTRRYNALGLNMDHPLQFAGELQDLPEWAVE